MVFENLLENIPKFIFCDKEFVESPEPYTESKMCLYFRTERRTNHSMGSVRTKKKILHFLGGIEYQKISCKHRRKKYLIHIFSVYDVSTRKIVQHVVAEHTVTLLYNIIKKIYRY